MLGTTIKLRWHVIVLTILTLAMALPGLSSLPVIDRDEARYAQASVQMAESGDLLNIRFQDQARNKKPAAVYWAQTAMIKIMPKDGKRRIWAQRLPSVFGALLSILALYWGGLRMVGRQAAFIGAALLATSLIFVFEGHIAKTDALLCASTTVIFAALGRLRNGGGKFEAWAFWIALGLSMMIKGPIGPLLVILVLISLWIFERNLSWAKPLLNWGAILLFILIWLPWAVAIFIETNGAFFVESLGKDFGGKAISGQESHGAPPGSHSLVIWATLWPASLFLLPGLFYAFRAAKLNLDNTVSMAMRFALAWVIPFWVLIEIMPTKLPHYGLPIFPALCLMMGATIIAMSQIGGFAKSRFISGFIFMLVTMGVISGILYVQTLYGPTENLTISYVLCAIAGLPAIIAGFALWGAKMRMAFYSVLFSSLIMMGGAYGYILPNLEAFQTSERLNAELKRFAPSASASAIHSPHFTEPSLVYHAGKDIDLTGRRPDFNRNSIIVLDAQRKGAREDSLALSETAAKRGLCLESSEPVKGFNYSKGNAVTLVILREAPCLDRTFSEPPAAKVDKPDQE